MKLPDERDGFLPSRGPVQLAILPQDSAQRRMNLIIGTHHEKWKAGLNSEVTSSRHSVTFMQSSCQKGQRRPSDWSTNGFEGLRQFTPLPGRNNLRGGQLVAPFIVGCQMVTWQILSHARRSRTGVACLISEPAAFDRTSLRPDRRRRSIRSTFQDDQHFRYVRFRVWNIDC